MPAPSPVAVVDTNVVLDLLSVHDLLEAYDKGGAADLDASRLVYRHARARESLLLAVYLHNSKATTFSLQSETVDLLTRVAPPTPRVEYASRPTSPPRSSGS